jgi:hypothetical protein
MAAAGYETGHIVLYEWAGKDESILDERWWYKLQ